MNILREGLGTLVIVIIWTGSVSMGLEAKILLFILAFDLMSLVPKIAIFILDFFMDISGTGIFLLGLVVAEAVVQLLDINLLFGYVLKPLAVFGILYASNISMPIAALGAGIDLLLNISKQYI
jgi:hypothetical protein